MKYLIAIIMLSVSMLSMADSGFYGGASFNVINTDITRHSGFSVNAGYQFSNAFSIEARNMSDSTAGTHHGVKIDIGEIYGAYVTAALPISESLAPYVVAGWSKGEYRATYQGERVDVTDESGSYGAGIRYKMHPNLFGRLEYMQISDDVDLISANLNLMF